MRRLTSSPRQFRWERRFWAALIAPTVLWAWLWPGSWTRFGLLFNAFLSLYALVKGAGGQEQAAEAKEAASTDSEQLSALG